MSLSMIVTGDVNLMNVANPRQPFTRVRKELDAADIVFSNLECLLHERPAGMSLKGEGFYADPKIGGEALVAAGIDAVGCANNVTFGTEGITGSLARLREVGIPVTGAGLDRESAHAPVILKKNGLRVGFLQRSSVFWATNHEAEESTPGIAVVRAQTAYQVPMYRETTATPPLNRPGIPPVVVTWPDPKDLKVFTDEIAALRKKVDVVVASCHWGLRKDVLEYMPEIAHAAIDAGADVVVGHGPHYSLALESYKGKPIYYGLGGFCFHTGHHGLKHGNWIGMIATLEVEKKKVLRAGFRFVRHNDANETVLCKLSNEQAEFDDIAKRSAAFGTKLVKQGDEVLIQAG